MVEALGHVVWFVIGFCVCAGLFMRDPTSEHKRKLISEWTSELDDETRQRAQAAAAARRRARG